MKDKKAQPTVNLNKVQQVSKMMDEMKELAMNFLQMYKELNKKEKNMVGVVAMALTSPYGLGEVGVFDAFIGDIFQVQASIDRLLYKMRNPPRMPRANPPAIIPATGSDRLPN